ncbi:MAG TPA: hypothetical protein VFZ61_15090 [Polyangiales bacterium]
MGTNTCELNTGRLLEIRVGKGYETPDDVKNMIAMIRARVSTLPDDVKHVTIADWRACRLLTTEAAEHALNMFRGVNPRTERSLLIHTGQSPTAVMQFLRLVREADHPNRRLFTDVEQALAWVNEVLTPAEAERARVFLAGQRLPATGEAR